MKIAIAGTRGIPNDYGGFEQCAQYLSVILAEKGHEVTVFNSHDHQFKESTYKGVAIKHIYNPENNIGAAGNFIYDYLCMRYAIVNKFDVILMLGYTTASMFYPLMDFGKTALVTNMDGLEWKRDKWNSAVKKLALWFEKLAAKYSHFHIADNERIRDYLVSKYNIDPVCIPYGSDMISSFDKSVIEQYEVEPGRYSLLIARLEPENNIRMVLQGYSASALQEPLLVIGKVNTKYGLDLQREYSGDKRIWFLGGIYNIGHLNNLRHFSKIYFHGHSVGGTNPSLLEAMASGCLIMAHGNDFNKWVTGDDALYFSSVDEITGVLDAPGTLEALRNRMTENNLTKIEGPFSWEVVAASYEKKLENSVNRFQSWLQPELQDNT